MDTSAIIESFLEFKDDKNIDRITLMGLLEQSFRLLLIKQYGSDENFDIVVNANKGDLQILHNKMVVADDKIEDEHSEIALSDALKIEEDYEINNSIKDIINKLNDYSKEILENNKLKITKDKYITKRKELNSYLYFIKKLNKWNTCSICPICITNKIDSYCNPCGHTACKKCLDRKSATDNNLNSNKCPICREYISEIRKLFFI